MLSVGDILKIDCFREAELLTGAELGIPSIGSVTVGEVPDIAQWLTGGEMVLTTLYSAREAGDETFKTVEEIIKSPAGALIVKLGRFVASLPDAIINLANEKRFPIISLPADVRWTNVIMEVSRLLGQRELAKLTWMEAVRQQFGRITSGDGGPTLIAEILYGLIGCRVVIEDLLGGVLAQSLDLDGIEEPERLERPEGFEGFEQCEELERQSSGIGVRRTNANRDGKGRQSTQYGSASTFDQLGKDSSHYRIEQNISPNSYLYYAISKRKKPGLTKYAFELDDGRDHCGYLVVVANEQDDDVDDTGLIDETQLLAIEKAVEAANIEMSKMRASIDAEMRLMGNLFALLNSGNLSHEQAVSRAAFLQVDLSAGFIVCIIDLLHAEEGSGSRTIEQIMERSFGITKRVALTYFPGSLVALDGKRINILLVPPAGIEPTRRRGLTGSTIEQVAQGLNGTMPGATFRIGASSFHTNATDVNIAHNEAITAALISAATGRINGIGNFRDLGLYKLLLHINRSHPEEARNFYSDTLATIEEYDKKREGDLMHTLEVFFASRENINDTAAQLFTHRHTIRYRLQRIADLSGLDPFDPDDREVLRVAVKLKKLITLA